MSFWKQLTNTRADLALYYGQDLINCQHLTMSEAAYFFECQPFENWKKGKENQNKAVSSVITGINNIIRGLSMLGKVLSGRR